MNHADFLKYLTRLLPMDPFSTPRKHQKALRFSDIFRGWRGGGEEKGCTGNKLVNVLKTQYETCLTFTLQAGKISF